MKIARLNDGTIDVALTNGAVGNFDRMDDARRWALVFEDRAEWDDAECNDFGKRIEIDKSGREIVRYNTKAKYTKEQLARQREDFAKEAKAGKQIMLSDLMCNAGM